MPPSFEMADMGKGREQATAEGRPTYNQLIELSRVQKVKKFHRLYEKGGIEIEIRERNHALAESLCT